MGRFKQLTIEDGPQTSQSRCEYWDWEEWAAADRAFDAGEWSDALRGPNPHDPCGKCAVCEEVEAGWDEYEAARVESRRQTG